MESPKGTQLDPATERLASELADVEASISMVASGAASSITLTGLVFGRQVAERLAEGATHQGVRLDATFWPEDSAVDIHISQANRAAGSPRDAEAQRG